jgi:hypothetical protein
MRQKVTRMDKANVNRNHSNNGGFGSGYMSYTKKRARELYSKKVRQTPIYYKYIYYYYFNIFNVTHVTLLLTIAIIDVIGLRYNVTSCNLLRC